MSEATLPPPPSTSHTKIITKAIVHPLVLLSATDHFHRISKTTSLKRVVGILLGSLRKGVLDISNSFAVPFDEDEKEKGIWFLDHEYLENMCRMFRKVNAKEKIVGWYHTGPKLHQNDVEINELIKKYANNSVLVIIDVSGQADRGLPSKAYIAVEEVHEDGTPALMTFKHIPSEIEAEEAEEVGVESLLRDIRNISVGTLSQRITKQLSGLQGLHKSMAIIAHYLERVRKQEVPLNYAIVYQLQHIFNLLPDMNLTEFTRSMNVKVNDQMLIVYLSSVVRSITALHDLIDNKVENHKREKKAAVDEEQRAKAAAEKAGSGGDVGTKEGTTGGSSTAKK